MCSSNRGARVKSKSAEASSLKLDEFRGCFGVDKRGFGRAVLSFSSCRLMWQVWPEINDCGGALRWMIAVVERCRM